MPLLTVDYTTLEAPALFSQSLRETGFAVVSNHPIAPKLIQQVYQQWNDFFDLPLEEKQVYLYQKATQQGYFPFRTENAKNSKWSDLKEFYHFYLGGRVPLKLQEITLQMYQALNLLATELLQWIEDFLPLHISQQLSVPLSAMIAESPRTLLRIIHYPPLPSGVEKDAVRAAPHEDINLITLLPAATAPGLEVLDVHGQWHAVNCDPGTIVVNVGDMLQMCTQEYYHSTTHRVVNPAGNVENNSRYSMPLFLHPRKEVKLSSTVTALDYLDQRLREIGIY